MSITAKSPRTARDAAARAQLRDVEAGPTAECGGTFADAGLFGGGRSQRSRWGEPRSWLWQPYRIGISQERRNRRSLLAERDLGLLLPCNVIVYRHEGTTHVSAFDPMAMGVVVEKPAIQPIAGEVRAKLERVIAAV